MLRNFTPGCTRSPPHFYPAAPSSQPTLFHNSLRRGAPLESGGRFPPFQAQRSPEERASRTRTDLPSAAQVVASLASDLGTQRGNEARALLEAAGRRAAQCPQPTPYLGQTSITESDRNLSNTEECVQHHVCVALCCR